MAIKVFLFIATISSALVGTLEACTCNIRPPVCYEYWRSEAIFVGTITNVEKLEYSVLESVSVRVDENFLGLNSSTAKTYNYGHSCAFDFTKGQTYLFYAGLNKDNPSEFGTSFCARTTRKGQDTFASDMEFLQAVKAGQSQFWIWGTISSIGYEMPLAGIRAELLGAKTKSSAISDDRGDIKFIVSDPGKYRVRVYLPARTNGVNWLLRNDRKLWEEQQKLIVGGVFSGKSQYVDYEVTVLANRCGWFDVSIPPPLK